jgi:hypothetical protein
MLASVFGEPALVQDGFGGCEAQHQQTAFAKRKWQDAMCSTSRRMPAKK